MMKIGLMAMASLAFVSVGAAPATATENPFARDRVVMGISDLDLATTNGQRRLAIRMDQAARSVCGERLATVHLALERKAQECQAAVKADIRARIEARTAVASVAPQVQLASAR
ncbi:UrcA family protein [Novosphingobium sp. BL-8A]|uniref:UrcA family protein n=1 Tax=Novosphingobium sp. BL-8A TaxID=3127639 RepID=UPI0037573144